MECNRKKYTTPACQQVGLHEVVQKGYFFGSRGLYVRDFMEKPQAEACDYHVFSTF
jgi:hypothetical protein